jgi:hypothetical protein
MKPLHFVTALILLTLGLIASGAATVSAAGAGLNQPTDRLLLQHARQRYVYLAPCAR